MRLVAGLYQRAGEPPPLPPADLARLLVAIDTGARPQEAATIAGLLPHHLDRLSWNAQQLAAYQRERLRALLAAAVEWSPFHARRLAGIDPGRFEPAQLAELPVMTKQQMMANFDDLLTAAASPVHSSGFAAAAARGYPVNMTAIPATFPAGEIVGRLNQAQPRALLVHASTLVVLAAEQRAGRLRISPRSITAVSEPLTEGDRMAIGEAFGVPPVSQFTSTEGLAGYSQPGGRSDPLRHRHVHRRARR